jgi:hypothetical protein
MEHSKGAEGLLSGDSEFRKATLILMGTWLPFPIWFILSPEGFGIVTSVALIQMGWAFLNIIAKFSLIFYMQRIKDNYCTRLKVKRELRGNNLGALDDAGEEMKPVDGGLRACVVETLGFLGMAENIDRFLRLLQQAQICSFQDMEHLTKEDCERLQLPVDLVEALQCRQKVWAVEMVDCAERDLELCEKHYNVTPTGQKGNDPSQLASLMGTSGVSPVRAAKDAPQQYLDASITPYAPFNTINTMGDETGLPTGFSVPMRTQGADGFSNVFPAGFCNVVPGSNVATSGFSNQQGADVGFQRGAEAATVDLQPLEQRLEKFENNMMEKLEYVIQSVGKQVEHQIGKSMEKSEALLEAKLQEREEQQPPYVSETDMQGKLEQLTGKIVKTIDKEHQKIEQRVTSSRDAGAAAAESIQASLDILTTKFEQLQDSQTSVLSGLEGSLKSSVKQLQASIEGSKSVSLNMEQKVSQFTKDVDQRLGTCLQDFRNAVESSQTALESNIETAFASQLTSQFKENRQGVQADMQSQLEQLGTTIVQTIDKEHRKIEQRVTATREANASSAETTQASLQIVTSKLEQLQDSQTSAISALGGSLTQMMEAWSQNTMQELSLQKKSSETNMASKIDVVMKRSNEQLTSQFTSQLQQQCGLLKQQLTEQSQSTDFEQLLNDYGEPSHSDDTTEAVVRD